MPCTLSFSPHVQRNAGFHVLLCPDTVEALLHLAIIPIVPFPRIRRREQQFVATIMASATLCFWAT